MPDEDMLALMAQVCARRESTEGAGRSSDHQDSSMNHQAISQGDEDALGNLVDHLDEEALESLWEDCDLFDETKRSDGTLLG